MSMIQKEMRTELELARLQAIEEGAAGTVCHIDAALRRIEQEEIDMQIEADMQECMRERELAEMPPIGHPDESRMPPYEMEFGR